VVLPAFWGGGFCGFCFVGLVVFWGCLLLFVLVVVWGFLLLIAAGWLRGSRLFFVCVGLFGFLPFLVTDVCFGLVAGLACLENG